MKVFISSLIAGMEPIRAAARAAVVGLGHEAVMAEDFGARPSSPQQACLEGIRQSGLVVLILGQDYGAKQSSGLSATHEEYREARESHPVIAFVQQGIDREPDETAFVQEVQAWTGGLFRGGFASPEDLQAKVGRAIHEYIVSRAAGPVNEAELVKSARSLLPEERRGYASGGQLVHVAIASGPIQAILRPSQMEARSLAETLSQAVMYGPLALFDRGKGIAEGVEDECLLLRQGRESFIKITAGGHLSFALPLPKSNDMMGGVIEEDVADLLGRVLRYAVLVLDHIDPTQRLTHCVPIISMGDTQMLAWQTRSEAGRNRNHGISIRMGGEEAKPILLTPALRTRASLTHDATGLVEDFVTLLRRRYRANGN